MKKQSFLLCCLSAGLLFVFIACNKKDDAASPFLKIAPATGLLDSAIGSSTSFTLSSNVQWKLAVSPATATNWLQIDKMSGENSSDVKLTVIGKDNSAGSPVVITASAADNSDVPSATFTVSQKSFLKVDRSALTLNLDGAGASYDSFTVTTNVQWKLTTSSSWLQIDTTVKPGGSMLVKVSPKADNIPTGSLNGSVTVTPVGTTSVQPVVIPVALNIKWGIERFSPEDGSIGTEVTIYGVFGPNPTVAISGVTMPVKSSNANQIVFTIPAAGVGGKIKVYTNNNSYTSVKEFILHKGWTPRGTYTYNHQYAFDGITFVYNGSIYFGLGDAYNANVEGKNTIYKLDTSTFTWSTAFTLPAGMLPRTYPFTFTLGNKVYIGGGNKAGTSTSLHDVWELDPATSTWRQMTSFPNTGTQTMGYTSGSNAYVLSEGDSRYPSGSSMYLFSVTDPTDPGTWTFDQNIPLIEDHLSCFTLKNVGFFGGGYDSYKSSSTANFYRYSPLVVGGLVNLTALPEPAATSALRVPGFSVGDKGYMLCKLKNLHEYNPVNNTWTSIGTAPMDMYFAAAIGNRIFAWNYLGNIAEYIP
jgi:hypothetical protein